MSLMEAMEHLTKKKPLIVLALIKKILFTCDVVHCAVLSRVITPASPCA